MGWCTLESKSVPMGAFEQLGLVKQRETGGGVYDAQRNRLIFPIHDQGGRTIAFGGRRINDADEPKYINSPDTRLFNKSRTLYGLHLALREIHKGAGRRSCARGTWTWSRATRRA